MQKEATRISITQLLCCIEIADQVERLQLLPGEADKIQYSYKYLVTTLKRIKKSALSVSLSS